MNTLVKFFLHKYKEKLKILQSVGILFAETRMITYRPANILVGIIHSDMTEL